MSKIQNLKFTIEEAFRECFYVVPDYQREYVWTAKEVNQLLEDLHNEVINANDNEYFIGTVLVSPRDINNHYDVIDGQQRLTTFYLILNALKAQFLGEPQYAVLNGLISTSYTDKGGNIKKSLKLNPQYDNAEDVINAIIEAEDNLDNIIPLLGAKGIVQFGALENIINAYKTIYGYLKENYNKIEDLRKYWGYLSNNVVFIQISTDVNSALKIFETINERGVGLNPMDLLKNLLFSHVPKKNFTRLKDEWKKITKPLEKNKEKPLRFLRYFLMANYAVQNDRSDSIVREDEIYKWFLKQDNVVASNFKNEPFVLIRKIIQTVETFLEYTEGKGNDGQENVYMNNIRSLTGGAFSLHYIILLAAKPLPKELFDHLLKQLETFLFYYIITHTSTKVLERNFSVWADELREIALINDPILQKDELNNFIINRFEKSVNDKRSEFTDAIRRYHFYSLQQYRTRYILAKLSQHVDMAYKGIKTPGNLKEYTVLEIEHILPNNPEAELFDYFILENPGKNYWEYKDKLGNLTLLEKPINIVAGRDFFKDKLPLYELSKNYLTSSIAKINVVGLNTSINRINPFLKTYTDWRADNIDERQIQLLRLCDEVWQIKTI